MFILLISQGKEPFTEGGNQGKCSHTGFGFRGVLSDLNLFAIQTEGGHGMLDGQRVVRKINGIPSQTENFASSQPVESTEEYGDLHVCSLGGFK